MAQLDTLKTILGISGTDQDALLTIELDLAASFIAQRRNSYDELDGSPVVETAYEFVQIQLATESYSKRGAEGEDAHRESGISRSYENGALYSQTTMNLVIPKVRVIVSADTETE